MSGVLIIGELLNSSRKKVREALERKDEGIIRTLARAQVEAGAHILDLNAGEMLEREAECLVWLVEVVQDELGEVRLSIDTSDPGAMEAAISACKARPVVNSVSNEASREGILEIAARTDAEVIGLPLGWKGMPRDAAGRLEEARELVSRCEETGIGRNRLYIDILCMAVGSDQTQGLAALEAARLVKTELGVRVCGAVSNVSFGLPRRRVLNRAYLAMMIAFGVDAVIMDPTDEGMREVLISAEALIGQDRHCLNYIRHFRKKGG
jgi:5-methyltetrahydrofolate--homocysteine methyltransferase